MPLSGDNMKYPTLVLIELNIDLVNSNDNKTVRILTDYEKVNKQWLSTLEALSKQDNNKIIKILILDLN